MKRNSGDKKDFSRRDFLKTTAVGVGAVALTGLSSTGARAQARPTNWDKEADVLVIGAGATGLPRSHRGNRRRGVRDPDRREL